MTRRLIILSESSAEETPYYGWLDAEHTKRACVFTSTEFQPTYDGRIRCIGVENYRTSGILEQLVLQHAAREPFDAIFAHGEFEQERAAHLRAELGLPGPTLDQVMPFRDKLEMKRRLRRANIPIAKFAPVDSPVELLQFVAANGLPTVVKPRGASGGVGVHVLRSNDAVTRFLTGNWTPRKLVESFIEGPMLHVDGLAVGGRVLFMVCSQYINDCLAWRRGGTVGGYHLEPSDPRLQPLCDIADRVIDCMPHLDAYAFHLEVFESPPDEFVVCEIACRAGGGWIQPQIEEACGIHLERELVRWYASGATPRLSRPPRTPSHCVGHILIPPGHGRLAHLPGRPMWEWCRGYRARGQEGATYNGATKSGHFLVSYLLRGKTPIDLRDRADRIVTWFDSEVRWTEARR